MYHSEINHSSLERHVGWFHLGTITNPALMTIDVQIFFTYSFRPLALPWMLLGSWGFPCSQGCHLLPSCSPCTDSGTVQGLWVCGACRYTSSLGFVIHVIHGCLLLAFFCFSADVQKDWKIMPPPLPFFFIESTPQPCLFKIYFILYCHSCDVSEVHTLQPTLWQEILIPIPVFQAQKPCLDSCVSSYLLAVNFQQINLFGLPFLHMCRGDNDRNIFISIL